MRSHSSFAVGASARLLVVATALSPVGLGQGSSSLKPKAQLDSRDAEIRSAQTIRVEVNVVPVDVTVVDGKGRPVTDLRLDDFDVLENGKPQTIVHFSRIEPGLDMVVGNSEAPPSEVDEYLGIPLDEPREGRTILITLGRMSAHAVGFLEPLAEFVRSGLDRQDRVALLVHRRMTDFTNDFEALADVLLRYRRTALEIEMVVEQYVGIPGMAGRLVQMRTKVADRKLKEFIEESALTWREVISIIPQGDRVDLPQGRSALSIVDSMRVRNLQEQLIANVGDPLLQQLLAEVQPYDALVRNLQSDLPEGRAQAFRAAAISDEYLLLAGVDHLRFLPGEKFLFFFSSDGMDSYSDALEALGAAASDARVRFYIYQTGGTDPGPNSLAAVVQPNFGRRALSGRVGNFGGNLTSGLAVTALTKVAEQSGGRAFLHADIAQSLQATAEMTRHSYLLAYTPAEPGFDSRYRKIEVRVKRKDANVLHRQGYFARSSSSHRHRKENLAFVRTVSAASHEKIFGDIALDLSAVQSQVVGEKTLLRIDLTLGLSDEQFRSLSGAHRGELAIGYFLAGPRKQQTKSAWDKLDLHLKDDEYRMVRQSGLPLVRHFELPGNWRDSRVKVVVYDYLSDRVGSAVGQSEPVEATSSPGSD